MRKDKAGRDVERTTIVHRLTVFVVQSRRNPILALDHPRISVIIPVPKDRGRPFTPRRR
jgi:hypothetical protein